MYILPQAAESEAERLRAELSSVQQRQQAALASQAGQSAKAEEAQGMRTKALEAELQLLRVRRGGAVLMWTR